MNLRTFTAISAVSMLVLGGCVIVGGTTGTGGSAGAGGGASVGSSSSGDGGGQMGGNGVGGKGDGGMGGAPACAQTCASAVTDGVPVCDTNVGSADLYKALAACSCDRLATDPMPGCKDVCEKNLCADGNPDTDCGKCIQSGACATEFGACSGDI